MNNWQLFYESLFEDDIEMLATSSKFMLKSDTSYGDTIEIVFDNGLDLMNYIDREMLLENIEYAPFTKIFNKNK